MIVLDASVAIEVLLGAPDAKAAETWLFDPGQTSHAPHLIHIEIAQVLRRQTAMGKIPPARAREALEDLADMDLHAHAHDHLLPRIWEMRHNLSAYDATYIALAEWLDAPLLTRDQRLAGAPGHRAKIILV